MVVLSINYSIVRRIEGYIYHYLPVVIRLIMNPIAEVIKATLLEPDNIPALVITETYTIALYIDK